jgi:hypothetical protein
MITILNSLEFRGGLLSAVIEPSRGQRPRLNGNWDIAKFVFHGVRQNLKFVGTSVATLGLLVVVGIVVMMGAVFD